MKLTALSEIHFAVNVMINGGRSEGVAMATLVTRGLQRVATERGRLVIIRNGYRDPVRELEYLDMLHAQQVAAIVLAGSGYQDDGVNALIDERLGAYAATGAGAMRCCRPTPGAAGCSERSRAASVTGSPAPPGRSARDRRRGVSQVPR